MNAADLWTFLEVLIDRNVPLHKTKVYVTVNGFDHVVTEPIHTLGPNGHEIHLADIESRIL